MVSKYILFTACPNEYPYAFDGSEIDGFRGFCSDSVIWDTTLPDNTMAPEIDENGNEVPFKDRLPTNPPGLDTISTIVRCPHFPTPCTDAEG